MLEIEVWCFISIKILYQKIAFLKIPTQPHTHTQSVIYY